MKMVVGILILCLNFMWFFCVNVAHSDTHNVTCSGTITTALQNAINAATGGASSYSTGDIVSVSSGTCTIGDITVNKNITLQGAGSSSTYVTGGAIESTDYNPRITGFNFNGVTIDIMEGTLSSVTGFRIDHNEFTNVNNADKNIWVTGGKNGHLASHPTGLIDNNTFNSGITLVFGDNDTGAANADKLWYLSDGMGSITNVVYIEDNTYTNTSIELDCMDSNYGGRFVFRHNTVYNRTQQFHGIQSADNRGVSLWEIYENDYSRSGSGYTPIYIRSGGGVVFNNTMTGDWNRSIDYDNQTSCRYGDGGIACDGANSRDGNRTGVQGYPCRDQVGRGKDATEGHTGDTQALNPVYAWNNKLNGTEAVLVNAVDVSCERNALHIVENRDYYNGKTSFNGTEGVGWGLFSARPATCTPTPNADDAGEGGVGYWATDTNTLYRCSATNTWTVHYQPAAYPHSLQGSTTTTTASITGVSVTGVTIQ